MSAKAYRGSCVDLSEGDPDDRSSTYATARSLLAAVTQAAVHGHVLPVTCAKGRSGGISH
jgi:hypothetical protein